MIPVTESEILDAQSQVLSDVLSETADSGRNGAISCIYGSIILGIGLYQNSDDWKLYALALVAIVGGVVYYLACRFQFKRISLRKLRLDKALKRNMGSLMDEPKQALWRDH